jgi:hypothetical protein
MRVGHRWILTPHYRLAYIPTESHSGSNDQRVINDQRDKSMSMVTEFEFDKHNVNRFLPEAIEFLTAVGTLLNGKTK